MTVGNAAPYSRRIRVTAIMAAAGLCGCATDAASKAELQELTASVRALRAENARIEARLERIEQDRRVSAVAPSARPAVEPAAARPKADAPSAVAQPAATEVPPLTVIKLKPKREAPPPMSTAVEVSEPSEAIIGELAAASPSGAQAAEDDGAADATFARGEGMLKTGNLDGGVALLKQFAVDWPRHPKADNALFLAGLSLMATKDFVGAEALLESVTVKYPAGDALLDALLKVAECRMKMNRPEQAKAVYQQIVQSYPGTQAASFAQARLADRRSP